MGKAYHFTLPHNRHSERWFPRKCDKVALPVLVISEVLLVETMMLPLRFAAVSKGKLKEPDLQEPG